MYPVDLLKVCRAFLIFYFFFWPIDLGANNISFLDTHANPSPLDWRPLHRIDQCGFHYLPC